MIIATQFLPSINDDSRNIIALLRLVDGKGFMSYHYADNQNEVELDDVPFISFRKWAEEICDANGAKLYSH